jgi:hypothetical protein
VVKKAAAKAAPTAKKAAAKKVPFKNKDVSAPVAPVESGAAATV